VDAMIFEADLELEWAVGVGAMIVFTPDGQTT
jgi:hypothetical protein